MEIWRNIKGTGRRILSPLEHRVIRYGLYSIAGAGITLFSLPLTSENHISPFEVDAKCQGSKPVIEVQGDVPVEPNQIYWLVAQETGSRRFRVLEKNDNPLRWMFFQRYEGFADPRSKYTEVPAGRFDFHKDKEYDFSIYNGGYSSRRTPFLDQRLHRIRKTIPAC